jgi:serine/threonine protein kinase
MILSHVMSAVKYLQKNGMVHRNIRPETILFESESALSDIKLVDLISVIDIADIQEEDPYFDLIITSDPYYRAPELIFSKKYYDEKVDIWSCGAILYNMITGIPPYFEVDDETTVEKIKSGVLSCSYPNYEAASSLEVKNLIDSMLVINKTDRCNIDLAIKSNWVQMFTKSYLNVNKKIAMDALNNMKNINFMY